MIIAQSRTDKFSSKTVDFSRKGLYAARDHVVQMKQYLKEALVGWTLCQAAAESIESYYRSMSNTGSPDGLYTDPRCTFWMFPNSAHIVILQFEHPAFCGSVHFEVDHHKRQVSCNDWLLNPCRYIQNYFPHGDSVASDYTPILDFLLAHPFTSRVGEVGIATRLESWGQIFPAKSAFRKYAEATYFSSAHQPREQQPKRTELWKDIINRKHGAGRDIQTMDREDRQLFMHIGMLKLIQFDLNNRLNAGSSAYLLSVIRNLECQAAKAIDAGTMCQPQASAY